MTKADEIVNDLRVRLFPFLDCRDMSEQAELDKILQEFVREKLVSQFADDRNTKAQTGERLGPHEAALGGMRWLRYPP
jgi:hypothetical protein